jgi:hypothetical protein
MSSDSYIAELSTKQRWLLGVGGAVVVVLLAALWWWQVYLSPTKVFWGMVDSSLATKSVVLETSQSNGQDSIKETVHMDLGTANRVHSLTELQQGTTKVKTEIVGTRDADYTRYIQVHSDKKNADGKPADVSHVLHVWSKSDGQQQTQTQASGHQSFSQAVLGVGLPLGSIPVPIGGLDADQQKALGTKIRQENVYEPSLGSVKKSFKNGHLQYTFDVKVQTIPYVRMMQLFAKDIGLHELDGVDPNTYQSTQPISMKLVVDAASRQLVRVDTGDQGYNQTYTGYGLPVQVTPPASFISAAELQKRLAEL